MLADQRVASAPLIREPELRRRIDVCVARALFDPIFASTLLSDPTNILGEHDCPPQDYLTLRSINASNLLEFAQQAEALFWGRARAWQDSGALLAHDDVGELAGHHDNALHNGPGDVLLDTR